MITFGYPPPELLKLSEQPLILPLQLFSTGLVGVPRGFGAASEIKGPYLDPLNPQTNYSAALLNLFRFLIQSPDYVDRLQRHYQMFRESIDREHSRSISQQTNRIENRRKRLRDPKRRRHHLR